MKKILLCMIFLLSMPICIFGMKKSKSFGCIKELSKEKVKLKNGTTILKEKATKIWGCLTKLSESGNGVYILILTSKCGNFNSLFNSLSVESDKFLRDQGLNPDDKDVINFMISFAICEPNVFNIDWKNWIIRV